MFSSLSISSNTVRAMKMNLKLFEQYEPSPKGDNFSLDTANLTFFNEENFDSFNILNNGCVINYFTFSIFDQAYSGKFIKENILNSIESDPVKFLSQFEKNNNFYQQKIDMNQFKLNVERAYIRYISVDEATNYINSLDFSNSDDQKNSLSVVNAALIDIFNSFASEIVHFTKSCNTAWHEP